MKCEKGEKSLSHGPNGARKLVKISCVLLMISYPRQACSSSFENSTKGFVERCHMDCSSRQDFTSCEKYKVVKWIDNVVKEKEFSYGPFRIVRIPSMPRQTVIPKLPQSRAFRSSVIETLNFVRDAVQDFLTKRALVYTIENPTNARSFGSSPIIMNEDDFAAMQSRKESEGDWRIFKKKKSLILPLLILLNLFKLKLLLLPIFLGVHFIKKALVLGSLVAPSILAHLKVCKVQPQTHHPPYQTWATAAEAPIDYPTGYAQEEPAWAHRNDIQPHMPYPVYPGYRNPYG